MDTINKNSFNRTFSFQINAILCRTSVKTTKLIFNIIKFAAGTSQTNQQLTYFINK